jgi:hypothetical protein
MATDWYQRMAGLGDAYVEGQKSLREQQESERRGRYLDLQSQRLQGTIADETDTRNRNNAFLKTMEGIDAPKPPAGGLPAPAEGAPPVPAAATPPGATPGATPGAPAPMAAPQGQPGLPVPSAAVPQGGPSNQVGLPAPGAPQAPAAPPVPQLDLTRGNATAQRAVALRARGAPGDIEASLKMDALARDQNIEDIQNYGMTLAHSPELRAKALSHVNQKDPSLSFGKDEKGYTTLTIADPGPDGLGKTIRVSDDQIAQLLGGQALMERGYGKEGLAAMEKVNADLAQHVGVRNNLIEKMATSNNTATHNKADDASKAKTADAAMIHAQAYAAHEKAAGENKKVPQDLIEENNALIDQLSTEQDPDKRRQLTTQMNAVQTKIANSLGKAKTMPAEKEIPPAVIEKAATEMVGTPIPGKLLNGKPVLYDMATAYKAAEDQLKGRTGGAGGGFSPKGSPADAAAAAKGGAPDKKGGVPIPRNEATLEEAAKLRKQDTAGLRTPDRQYADERFFSQ